MTIKNLKINSHFCQKVFKGQVKKERIDVDNADCFVLSYVDTYTHEYLIPEKNGVVKENATAQML